MSRRLLTIALALVVVQLFVAGCGSPRAYNTNSEQPGKACKVDSECADATCIEGRCYEATCRNHRLNGTETDIDCGGDSCPACPALKSCIQGSDCATGNFCIDQICIPSTCKNGNLDETETGVDCGGTCPACSAGNACLQNADCTAGTLCVEGLCYSDTCKNNKFDLTETDRDCGGPSCPACAKGKACTLPRDCSGGAPCTNGHCGDPLCFDLALGGTETDVDCGGSSCGGCANNKACLGHSDCESLNCAPSLSPDLSPGGLCSPATCSDGSRNQGEADIDCGDAALLCWRCPKGGTCLDDGSCESKHCVTGVCAAAACDDLIQNGDETGPDCGGSCRACAQDLPCLKATDCQSQVCKGGLCQARSCSDGMRNGAETGTDCGGPCVTEVAPQRCADGQACATNDDCVFRNCTALVCQPPTCANDIKDPTESAVDCGGSCHACPPLSPCVTGADCDSKICNSATKLCDAPSCTDSVQNGDETDANCGGVTCTARCAPGAKCNADSDCVSKVCSPTTSRCLAPTCADSVPNGNETGPDCGGSCAMASAPQRCGSGVACNVDNDCASNNCCTAAASCGAALNKCKEPDCADGKVNRDETGPDCGGGTCPDRCADNQPCKSKSDCASRVCTGQICQAPTCDDKEKNGLEMGMDCGSVCPPNRCPVGTPCKGPGDCTSLVCLKDGVTGAFSVCADATCTDGVKNGTEVCSADHGGGCPKPCPEGSPCNQTTDCDPAVAHIECISGTCSVPTCKDGAISGTETDKDCGDKCGPCANGLKCKLATDCQSNRCVDDGTGVLRCAVPTCTDVTINQGESGTDCGGTSTCDKCGTGLGCTLNADCKSGVCGPDSLCAAPTCADAVQNQDETDRDCGGPNCQTATTACDDGRICKGNADCKNAWCLVSTGTTGICTTPSCTDAYQNGKETDVNCGGNCPSKCANDMHCANDVDCINGWCNGGTCKTPTCADLVKNGSESGPDCGGNCATCFTSPKTYNSSCKQCADSVGCNGNGDCKSLNCVNKICAPPATVSPTTPSMCVGKVLEGATASCGACTTSECLTYLWCFYASSCDPGRLNAYSNYCTSGGIPNGGGPCSVNVIQKASTALDAAIKAYRCACP